MIIGAGYWRAPTAANSIAAAASRRPGRSVAAGGRAADVQDLLSDGEYGLAIDLLLSVIDQTGTSTDPRLLADARRLAPGISPPA
jgi:hypothetical protein